MLSCITITVLQTLVNYPYMNFKVMGLTLNINVHSYLCNLNEIGIQLEAKKWFRQLKRKEEIITISAKE